MVGHHLIKAWPATQASIALSSGEAEYYGVVPPRALRSACKLCIQTLGWACLSECGPIRPQRSGSEGGKALGSCATYNAILCWFSSGFGDESFAC